MTQPEDFHAIQENPEDYDDLKDLRNAISESESEEGFPLSAIRDGLLES